MATEPQESSRCLFRFDDTYARAVPALSVSWSAQPAPQPTLQVLNEALAIELGVDPDALRTPAAVGLLTGQLSPDVAVMAPSGTVAQVYAGHQFGNYVGRLGDGRALLLGEVIDTTGRRRDLHLKGSGRTPFARGGDGQAVLGPMLREYLVSEAMHHLGIPTTRGLSVVTTGQQVLRDGPRPGAVLCRVAASHLRVGTFQYAAALGAGGDLAVLRTLADYAIERHYPELMQQPDRYLGLLEHVVAAQAQLVARWMLVGFVHGVMNTDNMTISGETIDYGPCAFLDAYHPATVFSSIDHQGRYAYGNQGAAAQWNLARLAETLLPLIDPQLPTAIEAATGVLNGFGDQLYAAIDEGMAAKLGLAEPAPALTNALLELLAEHRVDYTGFFRALADGTAAALVPNPEPFEAWATQWRQLLGEPAQAGEPQPALSPPPPDIASAMNQVNPLYIPRNHLVEAALSQAYIGDLGPFHRLLDAVCHPYDERPDRHDLVGPGPAGRYVTYCGT